MHGNVVPKEWLSFQDLLNDGVVTSWQNMSEWQKRYGFPTGKLFGPNSRRFSRTEIDAWITVLRSARTSRARRSSRDRQRRSPIRKRKGPGPIASRVPRASFGASKFGECYAVRQYSTFRRLSINP
jgi:hypothetical protein